MKRFFSCLALLSVIFMTACEEEKKDPTPDPQPTALEKPVLAVDEVTEDSFTISWGAVTNAAGYTVKFDGVETPVNQTVATFEQQQPGTYTVQVKANAPEGSAEYLDSEYASIDVTIEEPETPPTQDLTFEFEVTDITSSTAVLNVYPSDKEAPYYFDNISLEEFETFEGMELCDWLVEMYAEMGAEEGLSLEETLEIICSVGDDSWAPGQMDPDTEYVVFAFGLNYDGTYTTDLQYEVYRTLPAGGEDGKLDAWGYYYGEMYTPGYGNYYFYLSDKGFDEYGGCYPNGNYYRFDIYAPLAENPDHVQIPVGTYTFDPEDTYAMGTFSSYYSCYFTTDADGWQNEMIPYEDGTLTVTEDGMVAELVIQGETVRLEYSGDYALINEASDNLSTLTGDLDISFGEDCLAMYANYEDYYDCGYSNWYIQMINPDAVGDYLILDLLSASADAAAGFLGSYTGAFTFEGSTFISGWIDGGYPGGSWYLEIDEYGDYSQQAPLKTGEITISQDENGIYTIDLDVMDDADNTITMEWSGVLVDEATISLPGQNAAVRKVATDKRASMKFVR